MMATRNGSNNGTHASPPTDRYTQAGTAPPAGLAQPAHEPVLRQVLDAHVDLVQSRVHPSAPALGSAGGGHSLLVQADHEVCSAASGRNDVGIHLVAPERPSASVVGRFAECTMARDQAFNALTFGDLDVPRLIQ